MPETGGPANGDRWTDVGAVEELASRALQTPGRASPAGRGGATT